MSKAFPGVTDKNTYDSIALAYFRNALKRVIHQSAKSGGKGCCRARTRASVQQGHLSSEFYIVKLGHFPRDYRSKSVVARDGLGSSQPFSGVCFRCQNPGHKEAHG